MREEGLWWCGGGRGEATHNIVDPKPYVFDVMLYPVKHPILHNENDVLIRVAARQDSSQRTSTLQQIIRLHNASTA